MPSTTVTDTDVTTAFPRRPRPGIVMGLRGGQVLLLSCAGLLLLLVTFTGAFPSLSRGAVLGISGVLVLLAVATVQDRPAYLWLAGRVSHAARARRGNTTMSRPIKAGTIREPTTGPTASGCCPGARGQHPGARARRRRLPATTRTPAPSPASSR